MDLYKQYQIKRKLVKGIYLSLFLLVLPKLLLPVAIFLIFRALIRQSARSAVLLPFLLVMLFSIHLFVAYFGYFYYALTGIALIVFTVTNRKFSQKYPKALAQVFSDIVYN